MTARTILTLFFTAIALEEASGSYQNQGNTSNSICNAMNPKLSHVQCYCAEDVKQPGVIRSAECFLTTKAIHETDPAWEEFKIFKKVQQLELTNNRGINLKYVPTPALAYIEELTKLEIKHGNIQKIHAFAFANSSTLEELSIRDSQIKILEPYAFSYLKELTQINLDQNNIEEINRNVFIELPALKKIFFTSNKITTIHDKAFVHLNQLKELELNMNKIFSLNSETFSGLRKLLKLDLSNNNLEVIGENTFLPLKNLQILNLEGNKIQMLDDGAFNGLENLQALSLAHNKLVSIENENAFQGLHSLKSLSLKANKLKDLRASVIAPILNNFHYSSSNFDVEDNNFTCDCRLDWFMELLNHTRSNQMKIALENLKCYPDTQLRESWMALEEQDKNTGQVFEEPLDNDRNAEYEYYDESQLNGQLFYTDLRLNLLNCTGLDIGTKSQNRQQTIEATSPTLDIKPTHKPTTKPVTSTKQPPKTNADDKVIYRDHGVLDLANVESTTKDSYYEETISTAKVVNKQLNEAEKKPNGFTTSRLATVSAKPIDKVDPETYENNNLYEDMASDEAKPDKIKAHRSVQDVYEASKSSSARKISCVTLLTILLSVRLFH